MRTGKWLHEDINFGSDIVLTVILIIVLGVLSKFAAANKPVSTPVQNSIRSDAIKELPNEKTGPQVAGSPAAVMEIVLETPDRSRKIPARAVLEKIEVVDPAEVPDNEALGKYVNSMGGVGKQILRSGGKAYKVTFNYTNEGKLDATYDSAWTLQGHELEGKIASIEGNRLTYAYGQVPIWTKISTDPVFYHSHILKSGQTVRETVWFFPCPPVKDCLIGDFELDEPVKITLP